MGGPHASPVAAAPLSRADQELLRGVLAREPRPLARAITLLESTRPDHRPRAQALLEALLPHAGNAIRLGVSGAPGVGKSTFIEALGTYLVARGHRLAVLAVDPSSSVSGGSILGDKTRMERLAREPEAFIRPSPSGGSLGGVAERTREAMIACEAAGYDVVVVETVGIGQSEAAVAGMVDIFALLHLPHSGDELQAMKKGNLELADLVVVNKADIDPDAAALAARQIRMALAVVRPAVPGRETPVVTLSAREAQGIEAFWETVRTRHETMRDSGELDAKRRRQALDWMWALIDAGLRAAFRTHAAVRVSLPATAAAVEAGSTSPSAAALRLLGLMGVAPERQG